MPLHYSIYESRRDKTYYVNGLELDILSGNEPDFIPEKPTHTLADLIESYGSNAASEADQEWYDTDTPSKAIHRMIHRITVHQGGAMVNSTSIWENTYPEWGEEIGWLNLVRCENHHQSFLREVKDLSLPKDSSEWRKALQETEERIALDERSKYYPGWKFTRNSAFKLPVARNIKVVWKNPVPPTSEPPDQYLPWDEDTDQSPRTSTSTAGKTRGTSRRKTVRGRVIKALTTATSEMTHLMDISEVPDNSPLDTKVQAALEDLYEAVHEINRTTRFKSRLRERGPLVFPVQGWDMRRWRTSDGRSGVDLIPLLRSSSYTTRLLTAKSVHVGPSFLDRYRALTTRQYLEALKDAVIK